MNRSAFTAIVLVFSVASWFSRVERGPTFLVDFSFKTGGAGLAAVLNLESCFKVNGFQLLMDDSFSKGFGVSAGFAARFDNSSFSITTGAFKFSLSNSCESPRPKSANTNQSTSLAQDLARIVRRKLTQEFAGLSRFYSDCIIAWRCRYG